MTGTAVATISGNRGMPVMAIDPANIDYEQYERGLDRVGARASVFAGTQLTFKQGEFVVGYGEQAEAYDDIELVVNFPYAVRAWRKFNGSFMEYGAIASLANAEDLPPRSAMGDMDKEDWPLGKFGASKGQPEDPWRELLIIMCRTRKTGELFHFVADSISKSIAVAGLLRDIVTEARRNHGKLPVVKFGSAKAKNRDGERYDVPTFEIVGWVKTTAADDPATLFGSSDSPREEAETEKKKPVKSRKAPVKAVLDDDEDDEDEDEDAEDEAPVKAKAPVKSKPVARPRKAPAKAVLDDVDEDDEDENEDDDVDADEAPAVKPKARKATGRRAGRFS